MRISFLEAMTMIEGERYDLHEFQNGRLTNIHTHGAVEGRARQSPPCGYDERPHFGRLTRAPVSAICSQNS